MQVLPMDVPAELHRRGSELAGGDVIVATGPLVIMAHGLLALAPAERAAFWIDCEAGALDAAEAEEQLHGWAQLPHWSAAILK